MDIEKARRNLRANYAKAKAAKDAKKIKLIEYIKPNKSKPTPSKGGKKQAQADVFCQAVTLSGKKCRFRATKGCFCMKHA